MPEVPWSSWHFGISSNWRWKVPEGKKNPSSGFTKGKQTDTSPSRGEKASQLSTLRKNAIVHFLCSGWPSGTWAQDRKAVVPQVRLWIQFLCSVNDAVSSFQTDSNDYLGILMLTEASEVASFWCCREGWAGTHLSGDWVLITREGWIYEVSSSSKTQVTQNSSKQVRNDQVSTAEVGWYFVIREAPFLGQGWMRPRLIRACCDRGQRSGAGEPTRRWQASRGAQRGMQGGQAGGDRRPQQPARLRESPPQQQKATGAIQGTLACPNMEKACLLFSKNILNAVLNISRMKNISRHVGDFSDGFLPFSCKRLSPSWTCFSSILNVQSP